MNAMLGKMAGVCIAFCSGLTVAATAVAVPEVPVNGTTASLLGTIVAAMVYGGMQLRKKWSRDGVDRTADSYLRDALERATKERDQALVDARSAWASKNADSLELGQLRAEVRFLTEQLRVNNEAMTQIRRGVQFVGQHVDNVKDRMEKTEQRLSNSGSAPLGDK